jgi:hypothetical protein
MQPSEICQHLDTAIDHIWRPLLILALLAVAWAAQGVASLSQPHE